MADNYNTDLPVPLNPDTAREDRLAYEGRVLGFVSEAHQEADTAVKQTEGYSKIVPTMQAISGVNLGLRPTGLSHTHINEIGRLAEVMRAELTDVKPSAEYKTFNDTLQQQAINLGKMWTGWYYSEGIDQKLGGVIDFSLVGGSGYAYQYWNKHTQQIDVLAYDSRDVRPFRATDTTIESCTGLFLVRPLTVNAVRAMFPHKAKFITQDREGSAVKLQETTRNAVMDKLVGMAPWERAQQLSQPQATLNAGTPVVDLFYFYVNDPRINTTGETKLVGDFDQSGKPLNNYSYKVPPGSALYPRKRLIIFTRRCILYDGPNIYWHGMFPVSKYTMSDWQWTWLGTSPLWDCLPLQDTITRGLRAMDDHIQKVLRPPVIGDRQSVSASELQAISDNIGKPGSRWLQNAMGNGVEVVKIEQLDPIISEMMELCFVKMAERCGVRDMGALLSLNQMPEGQTIDKLMFATRPETRARSRKLEMFYRDQGKMFMYNAAQFINTRKKFAILGPNNMTVDEYDFDPGTFIPNSSGDPMNRRDEAENYLKQFQFYVAPSSLLRSAQTQDQMMALAMFDRGALDTQSLLEKMDWPNTQQVMDRIEQQKMKEMQMAAATAMGGAQSGGLPPTGGDPRGRPKSAQEAPQLRSDGHISESG